MVRFLSVLGLNGAALVEQRSFANGRLGERVTGADVTIRDDGLDQPATLPLPFDYEGGAAPAADADRGGVVRGVAWDRAWAARAGTRSTGHALPAPNTGPHPYPPTDGAGHDPPRGAGGPWRQAWPVRDALQLHARGPPAEDPGHRADP